MGWNRRVRPIETSLGYVLRSVRASACVGNARAVTECPLYLPKLHAKVVLELQGLLLLLQVSV